MKCKHEKLSFLYRQGWDNKIVYKCRLCKAKITKEPLTARAEGKE